MSQTITIEQVKATILPILQNYHALRAGLFGSIVRGELRPDSDIDILVESPYGKSLLDFSGLRLDLQDALGRSVDLVEYVTIKPRLKPPILTEEIPIIMARDTKQFLYDILECIEKIITRTQALSEDDFFDDDVLQDAIIRRLEIIGEATKQLPKQIRYQYRTVPWRKIAGFRDILIHGYFQVDIETVWQIVCDDIPALKPKVQQILDEWDTHEQSNV